ncbi:nucleotidyltransferase domain-containing protein [Halomonas elongata]|nr:nucleotidyltransferase domain-containing protein [Halomonas elongata]
MDPRAFILHKWFVRRRDDRGRAKRVRDEDQARLVATLLANELTDLPTARAVSHVFPHTLQRDASDALDDHGFQRSRGRRHSARDGLAACCSQGVRRY